jgi:hypothetical protein
MSLLFIHFKKEINNMESFSKWLSRKWLYGTIRKLPVEIRGVWPDIQSQAEQSIYIGNVCITKDVGYSNEQLSKMWNTPIEILEKAFNIFKNDLKCISIDEHNVIKILNWTSVQSPYQRLKKYRKNTKKNTKNDTPESNT